MRPTRVRGRLRRPLLIAWLTVEVVATVVATVVAADDDAAMRDDAAVSTSTDDALAVADRAYGDGLAVFERAQVEAGVGDDAAAAADLRVARAALRLAIARYRDAIGASATRLPDAERRLADALHVGLACCNRTSLWRRYGVDEPMRDR